MQADLIGPGFVVVSGTAVYKFGKQKQRTISPGALPVPR